MSTTTNFNPEVFVVPAFSPEEMELRRQGIGSSDVASLFNEGYGCHRRLVYDKTDAPKDYNRTTEELRLLESGHRLEDTVAREFIGSCNAQLRTLGLQEFSMRRQPAKVSKLNADLRANIDRQIYNVAAESLYAIFPSLKDVLGDEPGPGVLEVKTTNHFILNRAKFEGAPVDWNLQVQEQFAVVPHRWGVILVKARDTWEDMPVPVLPEPELIAEISRRATATMTIVREGGPLPDPLPNGDKRCAGCQWRKTCKQLVNQEYEAEESGKVEYEVDDDAEIVALANDYKIAKFAKDDAETVLDAIKEQLKVAVGEREAVHIPGAQVKITYKTPKPSMSWDTKALAADHPELKDKYQKPKKVSRTFTVRDAE